MLIENSIIFNYFSNRNRLNFVYNLNNLCTLIKFLALSNKSISFRKLFNYLYYQVEQMISLKQELLLE